MCLRIIAIYVQCYTPELLALRLKIHTKTKKFTTRRIVTKVGARQEVGVGGSANWNPNYEKIRKNKSPGPPFPTPPSANLPKMKLPSRADLAEPPWEMAVSLLNDCALCGNMNEAREFATLRAKTVQGISHQTSDNVLAESVCVS